MKKDTWSEILSNTWAYQGAIRKTQTYKKFINYFENLANDVIFLKN